MNTRHAPGTMVFWLAKKRPYWVIEYQEKNGSCYWIVDSDGNSATATEDELFVVPGTHPQDRRPVRLKRRKAALRDE